MTAPERPATPRPAAYLHHYIYDHTVVTRYHNALCSFSARLAQPVPDFYLDTGCPSTGARPRFEELVRGVMDGTHRLLLIPGPWVFSSDDARARKAIRLLTAAGCRRILRLPAVAVPQPGEPVRPSARGERS
ncbi:hypothetical protein AB0M92_37195 [Streptomyces sp. NPDC051582]|uniref:hypothetical protein n=1 Tax=Streptomyces sp. NPDC051582 TaxID=3155167 RepID=UPI003419C17A